MNKGKLPKAPRLHVPSDNKDPTWVVHRDPPVRHVVDLRNAEVIPTVHKLLTDSQAILDSELTALKTKAKGTDGLGDAGTLRFARLVKALTELSKEEREMGKADALDRLSDTELLATLVEHEEIRGMLLSLLLGFEDVRERLRRELGDG